MCETCKARFCCYTGELPKEFGNRNILSSTPVFTMINSNGRDLYRYDISANAEFNIFGEYLYIIDIDYDKHERYYNVKCVRSKQRIRCVA